MRYLRILILCITAVTANVCQNDAQTAGSPLSGSFGMAGLTYVYLFDILEDQGNELLYFIGYFGSSAPYDTIIYKSDPALAKVKVMTYDIYCNYRSYAMSPNREFIYIQDRTTGKIFEVRTSDLVISRELSVSSASVDLNTNMEVSEGFYFSIIISSIMHTCRWNMTNTNLDCITFGVNSQANLAPINADLLFFGSTDTAADQYYLANYNFSSSSLAWKKSIACPTSGCVNKFSSSLMSRDKEWVYTMVLYDGNFIFQKLSTADGSPQSSGLIWNDSGYYASYCMKEFSGFIAVQIRSSSLLHQKRLILVSPSAAEVVKEYKSVSSSAFAVGRLLYKGEELMFHSGRIEPSYAFFFARSPTNNIGQLAEFEEDTPLFSPITTSYQVSSTTSNPSLTTSTKTLTISTSSSITTTDITSSTNPSFTTYVALWNQDHLKTVQSNASVKLEFTWACAQSANYTAISFSLAQTGSNTIPEWVQLDAVNQELHLNTTPKLTEKKTFYFSLQISFNSEVHYKKFEITVEECSIQNCDRCTLGDHSTCEACSDGYQSSDDQTSCSKVAETTAATETKAATAMVALGVTLAGASSILSLSSINSIFSIMNSLQLAILLPLVPEYFSPKVLDFLSGMSFTMLSFDFIKIKDTPLVQDLTNWASFSQSNEYLNSIGMRTESSINNCSSLIITFILIGATNIGVLLCHLCSRNSKHRKCQKFINKLLNFFTFNFYIRIFMQSLAYINLSIFSELYDFNHSSTSRIISLGFCILLCLFTIILFAFSLFMYCKSFPQLDEDKYWLCVEYFNGVKPTKYSKLYSSLFVLLRVLLISLLIFGESAPSHDKATYFFCVNIAFWLYLIIVRPFENPQDNIIEIINQALFCVLALLLLWINSKEDWTPFIEKVYITVFTVSPVIGSLICLLFLIRSVEIYRKKCRARKRKQNIAPKEPSSRNRVPQILNVENPSPSPQIKNQSSSMSRSNAPIAFPQVPQATENPPNPQNSRNIVNIDNRSRQVDRPPKIRKMKNMGSNN
ncbi:unnamed protein product [Moneuplotes crassus]|uniref:Transmembrane protein n=1 Tax=Euplotes crassus TaxID=5936 RepID=A0AAD1XZ18_EUPCR|nr:unnamed protein product [Moneuplotes crassus]